MPWWQHYLEIFNKSLHLFIILVIKKRANRIKILQGYHRKCNANYCHQMGTYSFAGARQRGNW